MWGAAAYELVIYQHILHEFARTLSKSYFRERYRPDQVKTALERLKLHAVMTAITTEVHGVAMHPEDDLVLAASVSAAATTLVTGDRRLREVGKHRGVAILTPREFLGLFEQQESGRSQAGRPLESAVIVQAGNDDV